MALHSDLLSSVAPTASGPDAEVIAACNEFAAYEITRQAPEFTDEQEAQIKAAYEAAFARMFEGRATTPDGFRARARALALWIYPTDDGEWPLDMLAILLRDMLHLPDVIRSAEW